MFVAEGTGCHAVAWLARLSSRAYVERVAGALMITPSDGRHCAASSASPPTPLPFPSLAIGNAYKQRFLKAGRGVQPCSKW